MKIFLICMGMISMMWAFPADIEENETYASENKSVGVIVSIEGKAKVLSKSSIKKHKAKIGETLFEGDKVITYTQAKVLVELLDSSSIIINASSEISFINSDNLEQASGEIYYKIKTRKKSQGLKVKTPFSIMGIKGTEFIVDAKDDGKIALNEGLVGIESLDADFELHKKKVMEDYEKFKAEQNHAFKQYKADIEGKIVTYVKAFDLEAGKVLDFSQAKECVEECESKVNENDMSEELKKRFEMYNEMIKK